MSFNVKIKTSPALTPYYFRAWMKYALQVIVTSQKRKEHKLNAESALFSALLPPIEISFWLNFVLSNVRRTVNRQPGYRARTRRADTQMLKMHTCSIYFQNFRMFIKISHFQIS